MRVLFLCKRFYTNKDLIEDQYGRLFHLPVELSRLGSEVEVLAADYKNDGDDEIEIGSVLFSSAALTPTKAMKFRSTAAERARKLAPDVVIASSDTHFGWLGQWIARKQDARFVFDIYDNYQTFAASKAPGMRQVLRSVVRNADLITVVSAALREFHAEARRAVIVPNGVNPDMFKPRDRGVVRTEAKMATEDTVVGYFGAITKDRGIETLLKAVAILRSKGLDLRVLLAGPDSWEASFPEFVDYRGVVDQDVVASLMSACDVAVLPYPDTDWSRYTSANKIYEYLACEVPTVATGISDYREVLAIPEAICQPADSADMARAIEFQLTNQLRPRTGNISWAARAALLHESITNLN